MAVRLPVSVSLFCSALLVFSGIGFALFSPAGGEAQTAYSLSLTDGRDRVTAGDSLIYAVTVSGPQGATPDVTLDLPAFTDAFSVDNGGTIVDKKVTWNDVVLGQSPVTMTILVNVHGNTPADTVLLAKAMAAGLEKSDSTVVRGNRADESSDPFTVDIESADQSAEPGDTVTFVIAVRNDAQTPRTTNVQAVLPRSSTLVRQADGTVLQGDTLLWNAQSFLPSEERLFTFSVRIQESLRDFSPLRASARVGGISDSATVRLRSGPQAQALTLSLNDNRDSAMPGDVLRYDIRVVNDGSSPVTNAMLTASLPIYAEFIDATEGGFWDGPTVRWINLPVAPHDERNVTFIIRVRSDAPAGAVLTTGANVSGVRASDITRIVPGAAAPNGQSPSSVASVVTSSQRSSVPVSFSSSSAVQTSSQATSRQTTSARSTGPTGGFGAVQSSVSTQAQLSVPSIGEPVLSNAEAPYVLLKKTSNATRLQAGKEVRYTITVQNILLQTLTDITVTDRFDDVMLNINDAATGTPKPGELSWNIPLLAPGQQWQVTYVLQVDPAVTPTGAALNTVSLTGEGLSDVPLTERVQALTLPLVDRLPTTGFSSVSLSLIGAGIASAAWTLVSRRSRLA